MPYTIKTNKEMWEMVKNEFYFPSLAELAFLTPEERKKRIEECTPHQALK